LIINFALFSTLSLDTSLIQYVDVSTEKLGR
jgi:hypothetical protein